MKVEVKMPFNICFNPITGKNVRVRSGEIINIDDRGVYKGLKADGYIEDFHEAPQENKMVTKPENKMINAQINKGKNRGRNK